jgi:phenylpropionate dioxygenase-like ring-hydroxylating dioxygenase large terminal subunit
MLLPDNHWYPVLLTGEVGRKPLGVERLGMQLVFWRDSNKQVHAMTDRCSHLGAALSHGHVDGDCIACPFHGFRFDHSGRCTHAPALGRHTPVSDALSVRSFPVVERHGLTR